MVTNIQNQGAIYSEIINILEQESDIFTDNGNGTFTHTSVDGEVITFDANTTSVTEANGVYTFKDGAGATITTIDTNTNNELTLVGNELTSTVNGKASSVNLTDANITSAKGITSNSINLTGQNGATLKDVTMEIKPGGANQVLVTNASGNGTTWVNQSVISPTTTNELTSNGNTITSNVNGVSDDTTIINKVENSLGADNKLITTVNGVPGTGVDLTPAIQANQNNTVVAQGTGITVTPSTYGKTTTYTVAANPAGINLGGDVTGAANTTTLSSIQGTPVAASGTKTDGQALIYNGTSWVPGTPKVDVANITDGKALSSTDLELSANAPTALLKDVTANIKTGAVTSAKILDGTVQGVDLNANVAGIGLTKNTTTGALDVNTSAIETVLADGTISNAANGAITVTGGNNATFKNVTLAVKAESGVEIHDDKVKLGGNLTRPTTITQNSNAFTIATGGSNLNITGLDKKKVQATPNNAVITDRLLAVGADDKVKALKAAMPKFFYMPSVMVPTAESHLGQSGVTFNNGTRTGTINLYQIYAAQFGNPVASTNAGALPVLRIQDLDFHVTYATPDVFVANSITINSATGIMTYEVSSTANTDLGSFINIVFSVKEDL